MSDPVAVQIIQGVVGVGKMAISTGLLPGLAGKIAGYVIPGLSLVADLLEKGLDPAKHIERIRKSESCLQDVDRTWEEALDARFPPEDIYD